MAAWIAAASTAVLGVLAALAFDATAGAGASGCGTPEAGVQCGPGNGRKTGGGGEKVPHNDGAGREWPAVTGILWKVLDSEDRSKLGGAANDELLGHHGDEQLNGGPGHDIIWGDWDPSANTSRQRDVLIGGTGNDWIYPSHGRTSVSAGSGRDYIFAFYGRGTINCGPGMDTARVRQTGAFKLKNCEIVKHFCAHGSDGMGGCRKPSAAQAARRR